MAVAIWKETFPGFSLLLIQLYARPFPPSCLLTPQPDKRWGAGTFKGFGERGPPSDLEKCFDKILSLATGTTGLH